MRKVEYDVCAASDVPEGGALIAPCNGDPHAFALFRDGSSIKVVSGLCPHQNTPLSSVSAIDGVVTCKAHGYRFNIRTGECLTASGYGLKVYHASVVNERVLVTVLEYDE